MARNRRKPPYSKIGDLRDSSYLFFIIKRSRNRTAIQGALRYRGEICINLNHVLQMYSKLGWPVVTGLIADGSAMKRVTPLDNSAGKSIGKSTGLIRVGDVIRKIDNKDVQGRKVPELVGMLGGSAGSEVKLELLRPKLESRSTYRVSLVNGSTVNCMYGLELKVLSTYRASIFNDSSPKHGLNSQVISFSFPVSVNGVWQRLIVCVLMYAGPCVR